jgi:hypothetical protein
LSIVPAPIALSIWIPALSSMRNALQNAWARALAYFSYKSELNSPIKMYADPPHFLEYESHEPSVCGAHVRSAQCESLTMFPGKDRPVRTRPCRRLIASMPCKAVSLISIIHIIWMDLVPGPRNELLRLSGDHEMVRVQPCSWVHGEGILRTGCW